MVSPRWRVKWVGQDPAEWASAPGEHVMASNDDKLEGAHAEGSASSKPRSNDRPFDMWLHKQLHAMYDEIASEPLPADLLNLIDKDAARDKKGDAPEEPSKK